MNCPVCGGPIDEDRVEFLRLSGRHLCCVQCSREHRKVGFMSYAHKTAPTLIVCDNDDEQIRIAKRAFRRSR